MHHYNLLFFLLVAECVHELNAQSAVDNLAFGFNDIAKTKNIEGKKEDCAGEKKIDFATPEGIPVLEQRQDECGYHVLKNAVVFLENPESINNNKALYEDAKLYQQYYKQWKKYGNSLNYPKPKFTYDAKLDKHIKDPNYKPMYTTYPLDQKIPTLISTEFKKNTGDHILNLGDISSQIEHGILAIDMNKSIQLYNLIKKIHSGNPENFAVLLGLSSHWITVLVDAKNRKLFIADSLGNPTKDENLELAHYIKEIIENGPCLYLQFYFNLYLASHMKNAASLVSLNRVYERIDKDLLSAFKLSSPKKYTDFEQKFKKLQEKF